MHIKLTQYDLQRIYDAALQDLKDSQYDVPVHLQGLLCTLKAFQAYSLPAMSLEWPVRQAYQAVDED